MSINKNNIIVDSKKALIIKGERLTEYEYDMYSETEKEIILWSNKRIVIFDKENGRCLLAHQSEYENKFSWIKIFDNIVVIIIEDNDKFFFITTNMEKKPSKGYDAYKVIYSEYGTFFEVVSDNKKGLYNDKLKKIVPAMYDDISIEEGYIVVTSKRKKGLYSLEGDILNDCIYDSIAILDNSIVVTRRNIDLKMIYTKESHKKFYIGCYLDRVSDSDIGTLVRKSEDNKYSLYSKDGLEILSGYESIDTSNSKRDGYILVTKDNTISLYSAEGKELMPYGKYKEIKSYKDGVCELITEEGVHGYYLVHEKEFVVADDINITKTGIYELYINGVWCVHDTKNIQDIIKEEQAVIKELSIPQQREYLTIALNSKDFKKQIKAIEKITDENLLFELANDKRVDCRVALDIIKEITNQKLLAEIVVNNDISVEHDHRRVAALQAITDEEILKELFGKLNNTHFIRIILDKIKDMDFLLEVVKSGCLYPIDWMLKLNRKEAVEKLEALNDSSINFRLWFEKSDL